MPPATEGNDGMDPIEASRPTPQMMVSPPPTHLPYWLKRFIHPNYQPTLLGHAALAGGMIAFTLISYSSMFWFAGTKQHEWLGANQELQPAEVQRAISSLTASSAAKARMMDQFQQIQNRITKHASIMGFFYRQYFISLSMICGASVVASLCLFFISKLGWERINNAVINVFIVSSSIIIFYGNIMLVFKQEDNIKDNQLLYLNYFSLRNEMLSYWATGQTIAEETVTPAQFIHYMDKRLQELNQIRLGFDSTRTPSLGEQLKQMTGSDSEPSGLPAK